MSRITTHLRTGVFVYTFPQQGEHKVFKDPNEIAGIFSWCERYKRLADDFRTMKRLHYLALGIAVALLLARANYRIHGGKGLALNAQSAHAQF